jgi:hypothetical protein
MEETEGIEHSRAAFFFALTADDKLPSLALHIRL